jgi:hypothetical protein
MIGLSLLSSVSKHNMRSYYDWVFVVVVRQLTQYVVVLWLGCCCCRLSVNTIFGHIIIGLSLLSSISKHYVVALWLGCRCRPSVSTIYGRIMIGFIVFRSVNTICGRIMIGLSLLSSVIKHNMWSYYVSVYCLPSVSTICDRIMIGLSLLSSVNKHNMWSYYDWVVVRQ